MVDVWLFASGLVIPTVMTLAFSYKAFSGEFYYVKILWSCIINFQNFMFSWFLSVNTNRLWAPCSGDQVHQGDKDSSCHKFFLTSPECDIQMHQWNPLMPFPCTLTPGVVTCPCVFTLSFGFSCFVESTSLHPPWYDPFIPLVTLFL